MLVINVDLFVRFFTAHRTPTRHTDLVCHDLLPIAVWPSPIPLFSLSRTLNTRPGSLRIALAAWRDWQLHPSVFGGGTGLILYQYVKESK